MQEKSYEDLAVAIEHISEGLERLALLALDLKRELDQKRIQEGESVPH